MRWAGKTIEKKAELATAKYLGISVWVLVAVIIVLKLAFGGLVSINYRGGVLKP